MKNRYFCIAEQTLLLSMCDTTGWVRMLDSWVPFESSPPQDGKCMCSLEVIPDKIGIDLSGATFLTEVSQVLGETFRLYQVDGIYVMDLQLKSGGDYYRMVADRSFTKASAYIGYSDSCSGEVLNAFLMMLFAHSAVSHHIYLMHASVVVKDNLGYAFLGKSGTGKSTHTRLWLDVFGDAELLNDDNPAVRVADDERVYIYGTPWSGKTPCYKNRKVELAACVRLEQAPVNLFCRKFGIEAFVTLLPSCLGMRWSEWLYTALCDLVEKSIDRIPMGNLRCLPNEEAVFLCYNELKKINK